MAVANVMLDTSRAVGSKLDPEMQAEIEALAPDVPPDGTITEPKLHDDAVSRRTIAPGAVSSTEVGTKALAAVNYGDDSVGTAAIADGAVTAPQAGIGVCTAYDPAGNPVQSKRVYLTSAQYSALAVKDPNTDYYISG